VDIRLRFARHRRATRIRHLDGSFGGSLLDSARDEIARKLEVLRRELHEAQSELARFKMLHARGPSACAG
jgi:hypothetical protein